MTQPAQNVDGTLFHSVASRVNTASHSSTPHKLKCEIQAIAGIHAAFLEVACGAVLSEPRVLLLVEDDSIADELNALAANEKSNEVFGGRVDEFLFDLAIVLRSIEGDNSHRICVGEIGKKARRWGMHLSVYMKGRAMFSCLNSVQWLQNQAGGLCASSHSP